MPDSDRFGDAGGFVATIAICVSTGNRGVHAVSGPPACTGEAAGRRNQRHGVAGARARLRSILINCCSWWLPSALWLMYRAYGAGITPLFRICYERLIAAAAPTARLRTCGPGGWRWCSDWMPCRPGWLAPFAARPRPAATRPYAGTGACTGTARSRRVGDHVGRGAAAGAESSHGRCRGRGAEVKAKRVRIVICWRQAICPAD